MKSDAAADSVEDEDCTLARSPRPLVGEAFSRLGICVNGEEFLGALDPGRPGHLGRDSRSK